MALDMLARSMVTVVVIRCLLCASPSEILKKIQIMLEYLSFECDALFSAKMDEYFHSLKDFRATCRSLDIYTSAIRRKP